MSIELKLEERARRAKEIEALLSDPEVATKHARVAALSRGLGGLREFVEAYVIFVHYVERLHMDAATNPTANSAAGEAEAGAHPVP